MEASGDPAMKVVYTIHALNRYYERFPNCPITIYQACDESIPYGRQTDSTKVTIHPTHKIVFIIDKITEAPTLRTVLTQQLYLANAQANTHARLHTHTPTDAINIFRPENPAKPLKPDRAERELQDKKRIEEKRQKDKELEMELIKQATEFAKLKNYEPWCKELLEEARAKYTVSRKNLTAHFIPQYYRECGHYNLFRMDRDNA